MRINGDLEFFALDGSLNSIKNAFIEQLASDPTGAAGRIYYNTTDDEYRYYDGTSWQAFGTGGTAGGIQDELDDTQASLGGFVNSDGTFNEVALNALGNVTGLTAGSTLVDALTQLDAAITAAAGVDTLAELTDVNLTGLLEQDLLSYDDTADEWVNRTRDAAGVVTTDTTQTVSGAKTFTAVATFDEDIAAKAGTAADPAIHFGGDTDSGLYQLGPDALGITLGGTASAALADIAGDVSFTVGQVGGGLGYLIVGASGGQVVAPLTAEGDDPGFAFGSAGGSVPGLFFASSFASGGGGESFDLGWKAADGSVVFGAIGGESGYLTHDAGGSGFWDATTYADNVDNGDDSAIPNKLYVDNAIAASAVAELGDIGDVILDGPGNNNFLVYNGGEGQWEDFTPAQARTAMGMDAGGTGDIWVEKAGDTMTGDLVMSGAVISNALGTAALPSYTFTGDLDTGMSAATADTLVLSAGGSAVLTVGTASITAAQDLLIQDGTAGSPSLAFASDTDTGIAKIGTSLSLINGGVNRLFVEQNGTLNVSGTTDYETLVTVDDDIPNKKYVDDEISAAQTAQVMNDHDDVTIASLANNDFLIYNSTSMDWENETPATARTALGLVAAGAGDIWVEKAGDSMTGNLDMGTNTILNLADPTAGTDAANKQYVDSVAAGLDPKQSSQVATDGDLDTETGQTWTYTDNGGVGDTLESDTASTTTLDGVLLSDGDRVLVKDQTDQTQNGIYVASNTGAGTETLLTRAADFDGTPTNEVSGGNFTFVESGTTYGGTGWLVEGTGDLTLNTDNIVWIQFSGGGAITAGVGLSQTGTVVDVNLGAGIVELPSDEVGIDLYDAANSALILTNDGTTRSTATGDQLYLLLANNSLTQDASGLTVAASTFTGDSGSDTTVLPGETMNFLGGTGLSSTVAANGSDVDVTFDAAVATDAGSQGAGTLGVAEFFSDDFVVTSGFVELNPTGVQESISLTFSPISGSDVVLTGSSDTLNIDSDTLTVTGDGVDTIDIDLNAVLSDLNDVGAGAVAGGGGERTTPDSLSDRISIVSTGWEQQPIDGSTAAYAGSPFGGDLSSSYGGLSRGAQVLIWDPAVATGTPGDPDEFGQWTVAWSDTLINASGLAANSEWDANAKFFNGGTEAFEVNTGDAWAATEGATAVFARWDTTDEQWKNFTPAQMVTMLNTTGGLDQMEFSLAGDSGGPLTIQDGDTLTVAGGTGITTTAAATDTVTVDLDASIGDLNDVTLSDVITALDDGAVLVYDAGNDDFRDVSIHYVETSASATSHTITHNLGQQYVNVTVVDSSDQVIIPQSITMTNANTVTVTLSSAAEVTVIVTGVPGVPAV